ncbi:beta-lactamase family protein [Paenibacillus macerans]|uniref:beta-lactamase family protein n=1 Tax=Paenibacillus macerans TaxID=44252 RepID=UPI00203DEDC3|nr:beta-lactamase family protein [Paenibacillus macerans]MCM3701907.1 beta-lactamase family protein [Paenibacillus macerans]
MLPGWGNYTILVEEQSKWKRRNNMKPANCKWPRQIILASVLLAGLILSSSGLPAYAAAAPDSHQTQSHSPAGKGTTASAAAPITAKSVEEFADAYFAREDVKEKLTGALFVVVKDGKVLLNKGYGYADMASKTPIDPDTTLFRMASISKLFTTTAVMKLADQGKIDLDRDISTYMDGVTIPNPTGVPLTMKNLMTHTTGYDYTDFSGNTPGVSLQDYVKDNVPSVKIKPGEAYRYDNMAFVQQGYIVENAAKTDFNTYVKENIFKPLGMIHSDFHLSPQVEENLAKTYDAAGKEIAVYSNYPEIDPSGSMFSTGSDMAKYMLAMLDGGKLGDARILEEKTTTTMEAYQYGINESLPVMSYGFESMYSHLYNGQKAIGKGGDLPGFHSWLWLVPEQKVGAMIIVNGEALDPRMEMLGSFMDQFFPEQHQPVTPMKSSKESLAKFEGKFQDLRTPLLSAEVKAGEDGSLMIKDALGTHKLQQLEELLFQDEQGVKAGFKKDEHGKIAYMYYNYPDSFLKKLPEPRPFSDVPADSPYAAAIEQMHIMQFLSQTDTGTFRPEEAMTRGEFVQILMKIPGFPLSNEPVVFKDVTGHDLAREIQSAVAYAGLKGTPDGRFEPDRAITRQEAASIVWGFIQSNTSMPAPHAKLTGTPPAPWASDAVRFVAAIHLFGPEVKVDADGAVDYEPTRPMLRQEAAAMFAVFCDRIPALLYGVEG